MKWLIVIAAFFAGHAIAAPSVSSHTSDCSTIGNTVVLTGTNFSSNGNEVPIVFDDFESGSDGSNLSTGGIWSTTSNNGPPDPVYDNAQKYSGSLSGYCDFTSSGGDCAATKDSSYGLKVYVSIRQRWDITVTGNTSKGVRASSGLNRDGTENFYTNYPMFATQEFHNSQHRTSVIPGLGGSSEADYSPNTLSQDTWYRLEYWFVMSDPVGATNGIAYTWENGTQAGDWDSATESGVSRDSGETGVEFGRVFMPFYMGNSLRGSIWYDDAYISRTLARVEICDSATWASCTSNKVIQKPTAWSDTEITFEVTQGVENITNRYLYVIDDTNTPSAAYDCSGAGATPDPGPKGVSFSYFREWMIAVGLLGLLLSAMLVKTGRRWGDA